MITAEKNGRGSQLPDNQSNATIYSPTETGVLKPSNVLTITILTTTETNMKLHSTPQNRPKNQRRGNPECHQGFSSSKNFSIICHFPVVKEERLYQDSVPAVTLV